MARAEPATTCGASPLCRGRCMSCSSIDCSGPLPQLVFLSQGFLSMPWSCECRPHNTHTHTITSHLLYILRANIFIVHHATPQPLRPSLSTPIHPTYRYPTSPLNPHPFLLSLTPLTHTGPGVPARPQRLPTAAAPQPLPPAVHLPATAQHPCAHQHQRQRAAPQPGPGAAPAALPGPQQHQPALCHAHAGGGWQLQGHRPDRGHHRGVAGAELEGQGQGACRYGAGAGGRHLGVGGKALAG